MNKLSIQADICSASTLPGTFYSSHEFFEKSRESVFAGSWQYAADLSQTKLPGQVFPFNFLNNILPEPLMLCRDLQSGLCCLSNVCTHRAKILVEQAGVVKQISCGYHGRCFRLDGSFKSMPCFEAAVDFPRPSDDLAKVPLAEWASMAFVSLDPMRPFQELIAPVQQRLNWLPLNDLRFVPEASKDYEVNAHWALYVDNFLEGFHIPFVHPALNQALVKEQYEYELFEGGSLQLGIAKAGEPCFDIPETSADSGRNIFAYYFWLFPNLMLNFYPWGLSLNIVEPLNIQKCRIRFRTYYFNVNDGKAADYQLDQTELEDEAVVESVQKGIQSRYYERGRFSPSMERGVHHFHRMLADHLK